ncbi:3-hydroxyacyl-CoA dehydrogenase/enoyl-CoA hydratase family protein [Legionella sp. W05-934-2]|jgi:3-hydroxyacyl-CoA dehydrogenase|uniref:3-hydroxyacyl-CoA dehydrogenase/enoyl-CoA hydratase family protein n=1 Tax=Legionella sp. W05-934-2 TaxID=1198649 RepID=UPI00346245B2
MARTYQIEQVAVLGAGVMGAQIAAHCVNAGFPTKLYELPAEGSNHNAIVNEAIKRLEKLKPSPLGDKHIASGIQPRNYQENLAELQQCDLIIEAIGERMDWKLSLYEKISPHLHKNAILVTNTSGLSINHLAQAVPEKHRHQFCGVHFFNPPRYMHLAELIPANTTNVELLDYLETWLTQYLGKGVVRAKDTPNFIANRIGVFSLLSALHHAVNFDLGLDEVDALTGPLLGRPKSATMRTMDVVGLDTMRHVIQTMAEQLQDDPWHHLFHLPKWLDAMIDAGHLGQKTGQGLYRKQGKIIEVYDYHQNEYRPQTAKVDEAVLAILKDKNQHGMLDKLARCDSKQARFLSACFGDLYHYSAYHLQTIANNCRDIDLAMCWGFGWKQGPFVSWQMAGVKEVDSYLRHQIEAGQTLASVSLPQWTNQLESFYHQGMAFSAHLNDYQAPSNLPVYKRQYFPEHNIMSKPPQKTTVFEHEGVSVWAIDNVAILGFNSKANSISNAVIDGFDEALNKIGNDYQGLVIYQDNPDLFCAGADLKGVAENIMTNQFGKIESMIERFQQLMMRIKYSPIPVVAALRGKALGGGCELLLHCASVVAAFESYIGLVELGVGVIPAGGGCKEFALRASENQVGSDLMTFLQPYYQQVAMAAVAGSALEARERHFLQPKDTVVMHANEVLKVACEQVKFMHAANYRPPLPTSIQPVGRDGVARLKVGLVNWLEGGFISEYDYTLASHLAEAMCGGDIDAGQSVNEWWYLNLERQLFMDLLHKEQTQARIKHFLETGKPLRN